MTRTLVRLLAAVTVIAVACTNPHEACGCDPMPPLVVVAGRVTDAAGKPVANARVAIDAVPATFSSEPAFAFDHVATTATDGSFVTRAFQHYSDGEMALRATVVRAGTTDTVRVRVGAAVRFSEGRSVPDTVSVTVELP
jgi:hypothetical protein